MSTITENDNTPLLLGAAVVVIILIAFFSSRAEELSSAKGGKKKAVATPTAAPAATTTSKKSKKKKSGSKAKAAAAPPAPAEKKKVVIQEPPVAPAEPELEPETKAASKKKKKKSKKKGAGGGGGGNGAAAANATSAPKEESKKVAFVADDDDESDDDLELWRLQSASKRKGTNDATKRAQNNKEQVRVRALKKQEEKAKAEAKAAAEAAAAAEADEAARTEAEAATAAEAKALAADAKKKSEAEAAKAKSNGASVNGEVADAPAAVTGEKKKRKRKKKKGGASVEESRPTLVKPAAPSVEHWETVPTVEEWQEVGSKSAKQKAKMQAAAPTGGDETEMQHFLLDDEPAAEEPGETSVTISAGDDPLIFIGRGGSTIQALQDTTGAKFHLNRSTNVLTISGPEDAVQLGVAEAQSILALEAERKANETEERVTWGSDAIKAVIGRGGANIRATQDATGVRIDADVDAGTLVIAGPSDQVSVALTMCHNAAFGEVQDVLELGSRNAVNLVYGPNFQTIRSLQDTTGCKLDITRGSTSLKLAGSSEAVADATAQIRALLEENRGFEMTIENSKVGAVYGKGGETLRSIQDRTGTQIDVSRGPTHANVSVMGTADASARARNMLQRAIDGEVELQPGEVAEEIELGSATAAVIGRGGSNVAELEKKHGVKINVRSEFQKARVVGKPEQVEAAAKEITAIAKPIMDAEAGQKEADEALQSGESAWQVDAGANDADGW